MIDMLDIELWTDISYMIDIDIWTGMNFMTDRMYELGIYNMIDRDKRTRQDEKEGHK